MFVRATGPIERLNEFNLKLLSVDYYHPENAADYLAGTDGYHALTEICPYDKFVKQIEDISELTKVPLDSLSNVFGTDREIEPKYLKKLTRYVSDNDFDSSDMSFFLSRLSEIVAKSSAKLLEMNKKEQALKQKINKLSHFAQLDVDINDTLNTEYVDVHFGGLPKDSMIKLYMYNTENILIFNTYSSDEKYFWGVYCAPKQHSAKAAQIMNALYFDELELNPEDGSVSEMIKQCNEELEKVVAKQKQISDYFETNKEELQNDYSLLLDMQKLWSFRRFAVAKADSFCALGWIPAKNESETRELLSSVHELEFTVKSPEASVTASSTDGQSPFMRPIRDIEHLSHHVGFELNSSVLHNCIGSKNPVTEDYLKKFTRFLGGADITSDDKGYSGISSEIHSNALLRKQLLARERYLNKKTGRLSHFTSIDVDLSELMNASYMVIRFGRIPKENEEEAKKAAAENGLVFNVCSFDDKTVWCFYGAPKQYSRTAEELFDSFFFKEYHFENDKGYVGDIIEKCNRELDDIAAKKSKITLFWNNHKEELIEYYSILQDLQQLWNQRKYFTEKNGRFIYTGSAPRGQKRKLITLYDAIGGFSKDTEGEAAKNSEKLTPPTKLKNLAIFRPYEYYVKMYGMPGYGSVDITSFVAITYTILFGIMFGDLGQGFVLAIGGFLAWKLKKMELGKILVPCGISSMFFGTMFGSVFGFEEMLDPVYHAIGMKGKPLEVMEEVNTVLLIAIGIGVALVALSIILNIYSSIKAKKYGEALFSNNGVAGLLLYICGVNLVLDFMADVSVLPSAFTMIVMPISAIILFMKEILIGIVDKHDNYKPDSISDFLMQNIFEMLEYVLSYFSNTVSFLRVGAFVLVHAGMMMVVFSLAGESQNLFVIILGNILIICLEGLLTGIQALRLEFYEMFSRCFPGDGKQFISAKSILKESSLNNK